MSAIDREKLLELIKSRKTKLAGSYKDIEYGAYMELETIEAYIESGAFDVREPEPPALKPGDKVIPINCNDPLCWKYVVEVTGEWVQIAAGGTVGVHISTIKKVEDDGHE